MSILVKISKKRIPYKQAMDMLEKRVNDVNPRSLFFSSIIKDNITIP